MQKEYKRNADNGFMAIDSPAHFAAHAGRSAGGARAGSGNGRVCVAAVCAIAAHGVAAANFVQYRQRLRRCLARHRCQSQPKCAHAGSSFGAVERGGGAALADGNYAGGNGKWRGVAAGGLHGWRDWLVFLLLGALAIAAALAYTLGRRPYSYRALGEVAVFLSFGLLGVCGNVYLQTHTLPAAVLLPAAGSGLLAANVLHINNIRDLSSDWAAGKHTLANKLGFSGSLKMHRALLLAGLVCYALYAVFAWQSLLWLLALPMILHHARHVAAARSEAEAGAELGAAVMLHFAVNALFAIGVLLT